MHWKAALCTGGKGWCDGVGTRAGGRMPSPGPQSEQHPEVTALWQF